MTDMPECIKRDSAASQDQCPSNEGGRMNLGQFNANMVSHGPFAPAPFTLPIDPCS